MAKLGSALRLLLPLALVASIATASAQQAPAPRAGGDFAIAVFAGGCFWCVEEAFEKVPGVIRAVSGYTGGTLERPSYEQVMSKATGHSEAVQVTYDPAKVSYEQLVDWFWRNIDPFDDAGQFCDKGGPYRSAIFYAGDAQQKAAETSKLVLDGRFKEKIVTQIRPAGAFWPAEDYHQDYYKKNPNRYLYYKTACGRAQRLEQIWGAPKPPQTLTQ